MINDSGNIVLRRIGWNNPVLNKGADLTLQSINLVRLNVVLDLLTLEKEKDSGKVGLASFLGEFWD